MMKAGSHVGECLDCILKRKKRELDEAGEIYWGHGGNRLLPKRVQCFAEQWGNGQDTIPLLMPLTRKEEQARSRREKNPDSAHHLCRPRIDLRAVEYSKDKQKWDTIHESISVPESRFALVLDNIEPVHMKLDRHEHKVDLGLGKRRSAAVYGGKHWFDHVCLVSANSRYGGRKALKTPIVTITYRAYLKPPYAVFLK